MPPVASIRGAYDPATETPTRRVEITRLQCCHSSSNFISPLDIHFRLSSSFQHTTFHPHSSVLLPLSRITDHRLAKDAIRRQSLRRWVTRRSEPSAAQRSSLGTGDESFSRLDFHRKTSKMTIPESAAVVRTAT